MSELLALGISHKTAPVALRERLAFTEAQARSSSPSRRSQTRRGARGGRDLHVQPHRGLPRRGRPVRAEGDVLGLLARRAEIRPTELAEAIYSPRNCDAARQLYRVTAGLESMIVGEAEIQGQVRRAHEAALRGGQHRAAVQPPVRRGADHRQARALGDRDRLGPRERPSVAVDLALSVLGGLAERHVVILGAGETSELTARALAGAGRRHDLRRQPPRRPRAAAWPSASVARSSGSTGCPSSSCAPTSCSPRPPRRTRSSGARSSSW